MKQIKRVLPTWAIILAATQILLPAVVVAAELTIPVGTPVVLQFVETIDPAVVLVGSPVHLTVLSDVIVEGQTVFTSGSSATGVISQAEKAGGIGKPAALGVTLQSVQAVDGTAVPVSGMMMVEGENKQSSTLIITILCCVLGLLMKGGDIDIPAGSTTDATVAMATSITV